ncbi:MAG: hypothetical protein VB047_09290 [Anaerotignum propionicum]|nr:hypothetical protein [Anaerotignum propionicum]MEA5057733.1 hypothetical protein [Anaerotignum propionicum]
MTNRVKDLEKQNKASLPPRTIKENIFIYLNAFCIGVSIFGTFGILVSKDTYVLLNGLLEKETVNYNISITIATLISTVILLIFSVVTVVAMIKNPLKKQNSLNVAAIIMSTFVLTAKFGKTVIFTVNIFIAIGVIVFLFIIHKLLSKV